MTRDIDLHAYEGLIFATAARYAPYLDEELDDIRQVLRVKVWQALEAFDAKRSPEKPRTPAETEDVRRRFVFSCVKNRVKDLLKEQDRRHRRQNGAQFFIEDLTDDLGSFEGRYLSAEDPGLFELLEGGIELPSTLSSTERALVSLLLLDYSRTEIASTMGMTRKKVLAAHKSVREKMADWGPDKPVAVKLETAETLETLVA